MSHLAAQQFPDGALYEEFMGRWSRIQGHAFLAWCDLPKGLAWLDVGCGNGAFTEEVIAREAPSRIEAIDPSPSQIAYAQSRAEGKAARYQVGDAMTLPFGVAQFDVVTMALVIAFVPDPARVLAEMKRVLRSGGMVAAYMWDMPAFKAPFGPLTQAMIELGFEVARLPSAKASTRENMEALWKGAGLQDVETRELPLTVKYPSFDSYWALLNQPMGPQAQALANLSPAQKEKLRLHLQAKLPPQPDGSLAIHCLANAVKGRV